uniref:Cation/H+ exchanger domain-containing protein n=1 Tax=Panagrolaimus davidi TaxID=227884 RepID=A0A914P4Y3_9BILA
MLELKAKKLGVDKGIPTLINAAASIDDAYAITWFSLILSLVASDSTQTSPIWTIIRSPVEVFGGIILGTILGVILWAFPNPNISNMKLRRITLLLSFALAVLFGTDYYFGSQTIGPIAVLVLGFVAAIRWHKLSRKETLKEEKMLKCLDKSKIIQSLAVLIIGLVVRCIVAALAVTGTNLNLREKIFVAISWLPKATVQAALAPVLMDLTQKNPTKYGKFESEAAIILTVAIIAILITAPTGAILVRLLGPIMLKSSKHPTKQDGVDIEEQATLKS